MSGKGQKYLILLNLLVIELLYPGNIFIGQHVKKWKILICLLTGEPGMASIFIQSPTKPMKKIAKISFIFALTYQEKAGPTRNLDGEATLPSLRNGVIVFPYY